MNIGSITSVLINKLGHFQIALGHVMGNIDRLPRRPRPVLQVLLPSSWFQYPRSVFWQVDGVYSVINSI